MTWKRKLFDASLFFHKLIADKFGNAVYTTLQLEIGRASCRERV